MNCIKCGKENSLVLLTSVLCVNHECEFYDEGYSTEMYIEEHGDEPLGDIYEPQKVELEPSKKVSSDLVPALIGPVGPAGPVGITSPVGVQGIAGYSGAFFGSSGLFAGGSLGLLGSSGIYLDPLIKLGDDLIINFDFIFPWDYKYNDWVAEACCCTNPCCNICSNNLLTFITTTISPTSIISLPNIITWGDTLRVNVFTDSNTSCNINCTLEIDFC